MRARSLFLVLCLLALPAAAQVTGEKGTFPIERLRPALDRNGIVDVEGGGVGEHLDYEIALWTSYALNPLTLARRSDDGPVERAGVLVAHRVGMSLTTSVSLFGWTQLGLEMPLVLFQGRGAPLDPADGTLREMAFAGLGDLRVVPKVRVLRRQDHFVDLAVIPAFTVPTGLPLDAYMAEGFFTFVPEVALSSKIAGVKLGVNTALRFRPESRFLGLDVGHEILYRAGVGYDLREVLGLPVDVNASLGGASALLAPFQRINQNPLEMLVSAAADPWGDLQLFGGFGVGVVAGAGTPDFRVFLGVRYGRHQTPKPREEPPPAECADGDESCAPARKKLVTVTSTHIEVDGTVNFDTDKDTIKQESHALLREVAAAILQTPHDLRVEVEGHTDRQGSAAYNMDLSQRRAEAVRRFLIDEGVPPEKLVAKGYGFHRPVAGNDTEEGRAQNRRVVFRLLNPEDGR